MYSPHGLPKSHFVFWRLHASHGLRFLSSAAACAREVPWFLRVELLASPPGVWHLLTWRERRSLGRGQYEPRDGTEGIPSGKSITTHLASIRSIAGIYRAE